MFQALPLISVFRPDINLLPLDQLPVQKILSFTRPPAPVAAAYLSAICSLEHTQPTEIPKTESAVDLRQYINQCQFGMSPRSLDTTILRETTRDNWNNVLEERACLPLEELPLQGESQHEVFRFLTRHADNISYLDSSLVLHVDTVGRLPVFDLPGADALFDTGFTELLGR